MFRSAYFVSVVEVGAAIPIWESKLSSSLYQSVQDEIHHIMDEDYEHYITRKADGLKACFYRDVGRGSRNQHYVVVDFMDQLRVDELNRIRVNYNSDDEMWLWPCFIWSLYVRTHVWWQCDLSANKHVQITWEDIFAYNCLQELICIIFFRESSFFHCFVCFR